jgi:endonuclease/exonuclease/phosphatase (EEP) superfamily protein YafD
MVFVRLERRLPTGGQAQLCVANLHADSGPRSELEIRRAAQCAAEWSGGAPLLLGGDFNARPRSSAVFDRLAGEFALHGPTADDSIDHVLARYLDLVEPPRRWPARKRDVEVAAPHGTRLIRLSDHAPVEASFGFPP